MANRSTGLLRVVTPVQRLPKITMFPQRTLKLLIPSMITIVHTSRKVNKCTYYGKIRVHTSRLICISPGVYHSFAKPTKFCPATLAKASSIIRRSRLLERSSASIQVSTIPAATTSNLAPPFVSPRADNTHLEYRPRVIRRRCRAGPLPPPSIPQDISPPSPPFLPSPST